MTATPHTIRGVLALIGAGVCLALGSVAGGTGAASAEAATDMPLFWERCQGPSAEGAAGECGTSDRGTFGLSPAGIAVDEQTGDVYVSDLGNHRISQFTAWGEFVRAFGWDVAPEGAPGDTPQDELETCTTECQRGVAGDGAGQLDDPMGLAVDSQGDIYVWDHRNARLQKFATDGEVVAFDWMVGAGVEQGPLNPGDICTAEDLAAGDSCGTGATGTQPRQFIDAFLPSSRWVSAWQFVAVGPGDRIYVGDQDRIQELDPDGTYQGELALPEPGRVGAVAVDPVSGDVYFAYASSGASGAQPEYGFAWAALQPDVYRLDESTGAVIDVLPVQIPTAIAVNASGQVFVYDGDSEIGSGGAHQHPPRVLVFEPEGDGPEVRLANEFKFKHGASITWRTAGFAVSNACGTPGDAVYAAGGWTRSVSLTLRENYTSVRAFGTPPDPTVCPPPERAPAIEDSFASGVGVNAAKVGARINPRFWPDTSFRVEYGTQGPCSANPCTSTTASVVTEQVVDSGVHVEAALPDLEPDTAYHYRVVAQSSGGGPVVGPDGTFTTFAVPDPPHTECENQHLRTGPSALLPDCRAFEQVSPADKNGGDARVREVPLDQAAPDGNRVGFTAQTAFADPLGSPVSSAYLAERDPEGGWSTRSLNPPRSGPGLITGAPSGQQAFTEDLCSYFVMNEADTDAIPGDQPGYPDIYRRENCAEPNVFETLTIAAPMNRPPGLIPNDPYLLKVQGFSADGSRAFFRANVKLTNNAANGRLPQLYVKDGPTLRLVSVMPSPGGSAPGGPWAEYTSYGTAYVMSFWEELTNGDLNIGNDITTGAISNDGSRAYWTAAADDAGPSGSGLRTGRIYLRLNPQRPQSPIADGECTNEALACTIRVSETISSDPAVFLGATQDGSEALFLHTGGDHEGELYRFTLGTRTSSLIAEGVQGILGASADLEVVYLVSTKDLAPGAQDGKLNVFRHEPGGGLSFVATLPDRDTGENVDSPFQMAPRKHTARVSPDGSRVAFTSSGALTGEENLDVQTGQPVDQVFLFDAEANGGEGELRCISCNPTGARPIGRTVSDSGTGSDRHIASRIRGWITSQHATRALSADGKRVFFESFDRLSPRDLDEDMDVYQWEEAGTGSCDEQDASYAPDAGGCVELITNGESSEDASFLDASTDGSSVFVRARDALVAWDRDGSIDIYDARIGGGFEGPPDPPEPCEGDECQGEPTSPPEAEEPGSSQASGGNPPIEEKRDCSAQKRKVRRAKRAVRRARGKAAKRRARKQLKRAKTRLAKCRAGGAS